ncbi:MAG TPA: aminopeptidase P family protein [Desulfomonilaceae bacterium]|nr:aminopeptidase P family protein [Desulfomonilaceae bacterium]
MIIRLLELHERLPRMGLDGLLFNTSEVLTSLNVRYLSGFSGSDAAILLTRNERHLFTDGRYKTQIKEETSGFAIHVGRNKLDGLARELRRAGVRKLGVESPRITQQFASELMRRARQVQLVPLKRDFLENLRIRKTVQEKVSIEKAASIASESCSELIARGLAGKKESEVAAELELLFRRKGASGIAFDTIVASGPRSALPHGAASDKVIQGGELVVLDYGCRFQGYRSDETVTCIIGRPTAEQSTIHRAVYDAHMKALDAVREGMHVRRLDQIARQSIDEAGYGKFFIHSLGHGLGLETHEPPYLSPRGRGMLKEGMVFTIEPGIYIEGIGGVRLESLVYLSSSGPQLLSRMTKDLISAG